MEESISQKNNAESETSKFNRSIKEKPDSKIISKEQESKKAESINQEKPDSAIISKEQESKKAESINQEKPDSKIISKEKESKKAEIINQEKPDSAIISKEQESKKVISNNVENKTTANINLEKKNEISLPKKEIKPKKEIPIEKKPFEEFVRIHLIPSLRDELFERGFEIEEINLENTLRPIAEDKCWVIYCSIKDTCNFWLSFEKDDISSSKSISLSKPNQEPSIIESFLIDEKRITLKLITSRIFQRLNGQKLIGVN